MIGCKLQVVARCSVAVPCVACCLLLASFFVGFFTGSLLVVQVQSIISNFKLKLCLVVFYVLGYFILFSYYYEL